MRELQDNFSGTFEELKSRLSTLTDNCNITLTDECIDCIKLAFWFSKDKSSASRQYTFSFKQLKFSLNYPKENQSFLLVSPDQLLVAYNKLAKIKKDKLDADILFRNDALIREYLFKLAMKEGSLTAQQIIDFFVSQSEADRLSLLASIDFSRIKIKKQHLTDSEIAGLEFIFNLTRDGVDKRSAQVTLSKSMLMDASATAKKLKRSGATGINESGHVILSKERFIDAVNIKDRHTFCGASIQGDIDFSKIKRNIFKLQLDHAVFESAVTFNVNLAEKRGAPHGRIKANNVTFKKPVKYIFSDGDKPQYIIALDFLENATTENTGFQTDNSFVLNEKNAVEFLKAFEKAYRQKVKSDAFSMFRGDVLSRLEKLELTPLQQAQFLLGRAYSRPWTRTSRAMLATLTELKLKSDAPLQMAENIVSNSSRSSEDELATLPNNSPRPNATEEELTDARAELDRAFGNLDFESSAFLGNDLADREQRKAAQQKIIAAAKLLMESNDNSVESYKGQLKTIEARVAERVLFDRNYVDQYIRYALLEELQVVFQLNPNAIQDGKERRKVPNQAFFQQPKNTYVIAQQKIWASCSLRTLQDAHCQLDQEILSAVAASMETLKPKPTEKEYIQVERQLYIAKLIAAEKFELAKKEAAAFKVMYGAKKFSSLQREFTDAAYALIEKTSSELGANRTKDIVAQEKAFIESYEKRAQALIEIENCLLGKDSEVQNKYSCVDAFSVIKNPIVRGIKVTDALEGMIMALKDCVAFDVNYLNILAENMDYKNSCFKEFLWVGKRHDDKDSFYKKLQRQLLSTTNNSNAVLSPRDCLKNSLALLLNNTTSYEKFCETHGVQSNAQPQTLNPCDLKVLTSIALHADEAIADMKNATKLIVEKGSSDLDEMTKNFRLYFENMTERKNSAWFLFKEVSDNSCERHKDEKGEVVRSYTRIYKEFDTLCLLLSQLATRENIDSRFKESLLSSKNNVERAKAAWIKKVATIVRMPEITSGPMQQLLNENTDESLQTIQASWGEYFSGCATATVSTLAAGTSWLMGAILRNPFSAAAPAIKAPQLKI